MQDDKAARQSTNHWRDWMLVAHGVALGFLVTVMTLKALWEFGP